MIDDLTAEEVVEILGLEPLPDEGGFWCQTSLDERSSAIYFLLTPDERSRMHRLDGDEIWHYHGGAGAEMLLLGPEQDPRVLTLGMDLVSGARPQVRVPAGVWQGARTLGPWTLVGTTMAPPFDAAGFELGSRPALRDGWPTAPNLLEILSDG